MGNNVLITVGMVLLGALTLLIEANRSYNDSLSSAQFSEHPILRDMKIGDLSTRREKTAGFLFYSMLYLVTYAVILSSSEIYALVQKAEASGLEIGPIDTLAGTAPQAESLFGATYAKPIYVSAAIIAIFSSGILKPIETMMRSLAHRLAGVPRGVYEVIDNLHKHEFASRANGEPRPLSDMFNANARASFEASFEKDYVKQIEDLLCAIDYLAPTLTGKQRIRHFPLAQLDAMKSMSKTLETKIAKLHRMLSQTLSNDDESRQEFAQYAREVSNDSIALFAVHYLRNNRAIKNAKTDSAVGQVAVEIEEKYQVEGNSFMMAFLCTLAASFALSTALYFDSQRLTPDRVLGKILQENAAALPEECRTTYPSLSNFSFDEDVRRPTALQEAAEMDPACRAIWSQTIAKMQAERIKLSTTKGLTDPLTILMGVAAAVVVALFVRDVSRDNKSWRKWTFRRPAFMQLVFTSLIPAGLAILAVAATELLRSWLESGFTMTQSDVAFFFQTKGLFFLMQAPIGFVAAIGALSLSDRHDDLHFWRTIMLAAFFGAIALAIYLVVIMVSYPEAFMWQLPSGVPFVLREVLIYGMVPAFFLLFYAFWLEMTEEQPHRAGPRHWLRWRKGA